MRAMILAAAISAALVLAATPSRSDETPAATESRSEATLAAAETHEEELVLPPGFKPKKRGKFIVYCKRDAVLGTRMPAERCYDEEGIRAMLRAQAEDREKVDQMRRICGSMEQCGGGG